VVAQIPSSLIRTKTVLGLRLSNLENVRSVRRIPWRDQQIGARLTGV
jgi:hypothetical protein